MRHLLALAFLLAVVAFTATGAQAFRDRERDLVWFLLAPARAFDRSICG